MSNLVTNLRTAAAENFKLFPEYYPVLAAKDCPAELEAYLHETPNGSVLLTDEAEASLTALAVGYGENDGFYAAGMSTEEVENVVRSEFANFLRTE